MKSVRGGARDGRVMNNLGEIPGPPEVSKNGLETKARRPGGSLYIRSLEGT